MEDVVVTGITHDRGQAKLSILRVPDRPGIASQVFGGLAKQNIVVDMIVQNIGRDGSTDISFTLPRADRQRAESALAGVATEIGAAGVVADDRIAKVSIVGVGMRSHSGVAARVFATLSNENINIQMISTSEIAVSCVIEDKYAELAVRSSTTPSSSATSPAPEETLLMPATAKAAVFFGPGKPFEIREVPVPEVEPEGVLIRVTHANVCGSDLHFWRGDAPLRLPADGWIFGHEMTGRVAKLGAKITTDSLGRPSRRATASPTRTSTRAAGATPACTRSPPPVRTRSSGRWVLPRFPTCTAPSPTTTTSVRAGRSSKCPMSSPTRRWPE